MAVKVYEKSTLSPSKLRAVKREAAMMIYMTRKRYTASQGQITLSPWDWAGRRSPCLQHTSTRLRSAISSKAPQSATFIACRQASYRR